MEKEFVLNTTYFTQTGKDNTRKVLELASARMKSLQLKKAVVSTTQGYSGVEAAGFFSADQLICVSHVTGFSQPNEQQITPENREWLYAQGIPLVTAAHPFSGVNKALYAKMGMAQPSDVMANVLRIFSQGVKVCIEIAMMAADAGLLNVGELVLSMAGSSQGLDTAIVIQPAYSHTFFDIKFVELICIPSPLHPQAQE